VELIQSHGLECVREPYVKHLEGALWEMRMKGKSGIARAVYVTAVQKKIVIVHVFVTKTQSTPPSGNHDRPQTGEGDPMKRKFISAEESFKRWKKDPKYVAAYDALAEEFALASALIKARSEAAMTQEQVAQAMGTTQAVVARLESGKVLPSARTLERFAKATRTRLRISFEPDREAAR
jgi:ribosome-binding protein aMBF1 (putative translation factor)